MDPHAALDPPTDPETPATLLPGVLARLEQRRAAVAHKTHAEILQALEDPQWEIRVAALRAMVNHDRADTHDACLRALHDEHRLVRAAAVWALGQIHELDPLSLALHDAAWEVREMAELQLQAANPEPRIAALTPWQPQAWDVAGAYRRLLARCQHGWLVAAHQPALLQRSVWSSLLIMLIGCGFVSVALGHSHSLTRSIVALFALTVAAAAAVGVACITRTDPPPELELTLTTPTPLGTVMAARLLLVLLFNFGLALATSLPIAMVTGMSWWSLVQAWIGPVLILASVSFTLTLAIGTVVAVLGTLLLEAGQLVQLHLGNTVALTTTPHLWQINPLTLCLIVVLVLGSTRYASRHPRHA